MKQFSILKLPNSMTENLIYLKKFSKKKKGCLLKLDEWFKSYERLKLKKKCVINHKKLFKIEKVCNLGLLLQNLLEKCVNPGVTPRNLSWQGSRKWWNFKVFLLNFLWYQKRTWFGHQNITHTKYNTKYFDGLGKDSSEDQWSELSVVSRIISN